MKKFVTTYVISLLIGVSMAHAVTKCERMPGGGVCCWDTQTDGPFRPISC
jgi:hypothetical protein